jgi:hypothetical protein
MTTQQEKNVRIVMEQIYNSTLYKKGEILSFPQNNESGFIEYSYLDSIDFQYEIMRVLNQFNQDKDLCEKVFFSLRVVGEKIRLVF